MEFITLSIMSAAISKLIAAFAANTAVVSASSAITTGTVSAGGLIATGAGATAVAGGAGLAAIAVSKATLGATTGATAGVELVKGLTVSGGSTSIATATIGTTNTGTTAVLHTISEAVSNLGTKDVVELGLGGTAGVLITKKVTANTITSLKEQLEALKKKILHNQTLVDQVKRELKEIESKEKENANKAMALEANNKILLEKSKIFDQLAAKHAESLKEMEKLNKKINENEKEDLENSKKSSVELAKLVEKATQLEIQLVKSKNEITQLHEKIGELIAITDSLISDKSGNSKFTLYSAPVSPVSESNKDTFQKNTKSNK